MDQLLSEPCRSVEVSCGTRTDWHLCRSSIDVTLSSNAQEGAFGTGISYFAYLKKYKRSKIVFDDMACDWKMKFIAQDWKAFIQMQRRTYLWTCQRHVEVVCRSTQLWMQTMPEIRQLEGHIHGY